jgi:hypothetical protein
VRLDERELVALATNRPSAHVFSTHDHYSRRDSEL